MIDEIELMIENIADSCKSYKEFILVMEQVEEIIALKKVAAEDIDWEQ